MDEFSKGVLDTRDVVAISGVTLTTVIVGKILKRKMDSGLKKMVKTFSIAFAGIVGTKHIYDLATSSKKKDEVTAKPSSATEDKEEKEASL